MKNNVIFGMGIFHTPNGLKVLGQAKINVRQMSRGDSFGCVIFKILWDNGPKTQPQQNTGADKKTCKLFNDGTEDEIHFLLRCSALVNIRKTTLSVVYRLYPETEILNDKFIWLMSAEDSDMFYLLQQLLSSLSEERINKLKS